MTMLAQKMMTARLEAHTEARSAARWLDNFFSTRSTVYRGWNEVQGCWCSVIALPYGERWRIRLAWQYDGSVEVNVQECPTGEMTLNATFAKWEDAAVAIGNAVGAE